MPSPAERELTVEPATRLRGSIRVPGDKSISHRYALLAALAEGVTDIQRFSPGADCAATLSCLERLGVSVTRTVTGESPTAGTQIDVRIMGRGLWGLQQPAKELDAANSGTTMRLLTGVLAAHPFTATLTGDASLRRRPMRRVVEPLERMGARIASSDGRPPLVIQGAPLHGIMHEPAVPSAQVKSAVLLAGLQAEGRTIVCERVATRDHTERALRAFDAAASCTNGIIEVEGGIALRPCALQVPGDVSSAAFWAAAAAALPGSDIEILDVGLNPTRTAFLDLLARSGADVSRLIDGDCAGEPAGRLRVRHAGLTDIRIGPSDVPALIDELPVLAALATHGGSILVTGASELRTKESDRITALVEGLRALGADAAELPDGFLVCGGRRLRGGVANAAGDHRLAMSFAIAALGASGPSVVLGAESVDISYPGFFSVLASLRA
jgi:3-phosphoshikimate 1-carboxyvinyltransferase